MDKNNQDRHDPAGAGALQEQLEIRLDDCNGRLFESASLAPALSSNGLILA